MEMIHELEYRIDCIRKANTTASRRYHAELAIELMEKYPELNEYYEYCPERARWENRFVKREIAHISIPNFEADTEYNFMNSDEHFSGLYWNGCVGYNPIVENPIFNGKVGRATDIAKRMNQYCTHNPMFWHNGCSLRIDDPQRLRFAEASAHEFLSKVAIRLCPNTAEWYEFDRRTYMALCAAFQNPQFFAAVADFTKHQNAYIMLKRVLTEMESKEER